MTQGRYPFNEPAFKLGLRKGLQLGLLLGLTIAVVVFGLIRTAHAETTAEKVFGRWEKVTPETILRPVPDWMPTGTPGAVTNEYRRKAEDGPAQPGRPNISPRSTTPEQVVGLQSNLPERR